MLQTKLYRYLLRLRIELKSKSPDKFQTRSLFNSGNLTSKFTGPTAYYKSIALQFKYLPGVALLSMSPV
ncbi:MAG: hypothetical protein WCP55_07565, partial [Lentisphaerota bacterium]